MARFIKLTPHERNGVKPVAAFCLINIELVTSMTLEDPSGTLLMFESRSIIVKESPKEIIGRAFGSARIYHGQ